MAETTTIMDQKLIELLDKRPSAIRNTLVIGVVRILAGLIGFILLVVGISFLIHNLTYCELLAQFEIIKDFEPTAMNIIGISAVIVGVLLLFVVRLCKMLIRRNMFLLELDEWRYEWEKENKNQEKRQM